MTVSPIISIEDFHVSIQEQSILKDVNLKFEPHQITCIIGPSGGGKSTLIRSINRMNDEVVGHKTQGNIKFLSENIYDKKHDTAALRSTIGMVFQKPCVFPKSIKENVLFGIEKAKKLSKQEKDQLVEENLKAVSLWKEVEHRLNDKANSLSLGQQQRLCIARTLAMKPQVILFDEPTSSLDPISSKVIEELMLQLKASYSILFVTHNIQQAKRIADQLVFICDGQVVESGSAQQMFTCANHSQTKAFLDQGICEC